jgi:hypothetical protein
MNVPLRMLRNVLGISLTWGILYAALFALIGLVIFIVDPADVGPGEGPLDVALIIGRVGLMSGLIFALLTVLGRPVRELTLGRAAMWGVLASAVYPLLTGRIPEMLVLCPVGAMLGMATGALARLSAAFPAQAPSPRP